MDAVVQPFLVGGVARPAVQVEVEKGPDAEGNATVRINGVRKDVRVMDERSQLLEKMGMSVAAAAGSGDVNAPMPGKVLQVLVEPGHSGGGPAFVGARSDEDGKRIKATAAGTVSEVPVNEGDAVEKGSLLSGSSRKELGDVPEALLKTYDTRCAAFRPWVISHHVVHEHSQDCSAAALVRLAVHAGPNRLQQPHRLVRSSGFHGHAVERHGFGQRRRAERVLRGHVGAGHPIPHDLPRSVRPRAGSSSVQLTMRPFFQARVFQPDPFNLATLGPTCRCRT